MEIPKEYSAVMPYLILKDARAFVSFAEKVLGGKENEKNRSTRDNGAIMHAEVMIHGSTIMVADSSDNWPEHPAGLFVYVENADETYQKALDHGSVSLIEPSDQPYGRTCGVRDPFGNAWWITTP